MTGFQFRFMQSNYKLNILNIFIGGPNFNDRPRDQTAYEDATVEMGCSADGYPSPDLVWTKNGQPLMPNDRVAIGLTRIRIERVRFSDEGRYRCTVSNPVIIALKYYIFSYY